MPNPSTRVRTSSQYCGIELISTLCVAVIIAGGAADGRAFQKHTPGRDQRPTVLFLCPHGAAKSVLASAYFQQVAKERGLNVRVDAAGTDPQDHVSPLVAEHLRQKGYQVPVTKPRKVTPKELEMADVVISMGCDLTGLPVRADTLQKWDDVPGPSEDFTRSDDAIRRRVAALVDELLARQKQQ